MNKKYKKFLAKLLHNSITNTTFATAKQKSYAIRLTLVR